VGKKVTLFDDFLSKIGAFLVYPELFFFFFLPRIPSHVEWGLHVGEFPVVFHQVEGVGDAWKTKKLIEDEDDPQRGR
jgi:hypothetical protein